MTTSVTQWLRLVLLLLCVSVSGVLLADSRLNADGGSWLNTAEHGAEGTEFYLTFMRNYGKPVGDKDLVLTIYATSRYDTKVYVEGKWTDIGSDVSLDWDTTFTVHANSYASANIPSQVAYLAEPKNTSAEYLNKGLKITSDKVITLYSSNSNSDSYDASLIYPVEMYSKEYVIQTFSSDNQATQLAVISSQDNNLVTVNIKETERGKNGDKIRTDTFTLSLNQGQTWLYQPEDKKYSLSGSTICATEPVTILQGGQHARIPSGKGELSHCYVNAVPTDALGKNYIVTRTAKQKFDYVTFVAAEDSTQIFKEGKLLATIDQLETYQDIVEWKSDKEANYYFTSKATGCFLFQSSRDCDTGSPTITDITAIENSTHKITFACFDYRYTQDETFSLDNHYVNIVLPKRYIGSMTIDGNPIGKTLFKDIEYLINNEQYAYATCKITEGNHVLQNTSGGFVARVYGQDNINEEDDDYGIGEITYSYSAGRNILHPAWILIDGKRVNQKAICEGDPPITFTSVINYDYTNVRWEFHSLQGEIYDKTITQTVRGDSIISRHYVDVEEDSTTSVHIDSVYMIVERTTPLCGYTITDTIKAAIIVNDTFALQDRQNVCYGDTMTLHYQGIEVKIPADTLHTYKFGTKSYRFSLNTPYSFVDSLKTNSACDTCKHCDSIINQVRIIRPIYNDTVQDSICVNHLPYQWRDSLGNLIRELDLPDSIKSKLILKTENAYHTETIWDSENFGTIYGCDSIVNIELTVLPIYDLHDYDTVCVDSIRAYSWDRHPYASGKYFYINGRKVSYIPQDTSGEFEYVDSLTTKGCIQCADSLGCDSIWTLHLKVLDRHIDESWGSICSNESYLWQDTLWLGWDFPEDELSSLTHKYKYVYKRDTTLRVTYPTEDAFGCDSTIILHLKIYPAYPEVSYNDTTYVHICENEPYEFYGITYNANGEWRTSDHSIGHQLLTYMDATSHDCDSAVAHVIYVHPTYLDTISVTECQSHTSTYKWAEITETSIWDEQNQKNISPNDILLNEAGDFIYVDSTKTKTCTDCRNGIGCDSVIVLKLHVNPIFDTIESKPLCENDTLHWRGKTYVGGKAADAISAGAAKRYWATPIPNPNAAEDTYRLPKTYEKLDHKWNGNKYTDSIHFTTKDGCDSIYWLELTVYPLYEIHDTLHVCDNKSIDWEGKTYAGSKFEGAADYKYATSDNWYTDTRSFLIGNACDSIRILHLKVHPSYDSVYVDSLCQDYFYVWDKHMNRILYDSIQQRDIFFGESIPALEPGWHTYVDNLSTTTCAECEDGSCDSIWTLRLYVKPTAVHTEYITICPEQLPYPYGSHGKVATQAGTYLDTIHRSYGDGCDSITTYVITVSEENRSVFHITICNNELPYNYDYGSTPTANLHFTNLTQSDTYYDTIRIAGMCNHILELHLTINDTTRTDTTYYLCEGDIYVDKDFSDIKATRDTSYVKRLERANSVGCDSVVYVTVRFGATHTVHDADVILCERDSSYTWHTNDTYGTYSQTIKWSDLHETVLDTVLYQTLHTMSPFYCDSVTSVRIQVKPTVYNEYTKTICPTEVPFSDWGNRDEAVSVDGTYTHYIVGGSLRYGCDSIEIMHLTIRDSIVTHLYDSICDNQLPYNHWDTRADNLLNLTHTDVYRDTLTSELTGCDSVLVLHLQVNKTYNTTDTITICASEGSPYIWRPSDMKGSREIAIPFEIDDRVNVKDKQTLVLNDSSVLLQSVHGCDSLVNLRLIVHPTYELVEVDTVDCQDTHNKYSTWIDQLGGVHQIDISEAGWITIAENPGTIYGCDSIIGIKLYVRPTYRYDSVYTICQDERITWQGKTYAGSHYGYNYQMLSDGKYAEHRDSVYYLYEPGDSILEAGVHHDTIVYSTMLGCDSTFYLTLNVLPTRDTILDVSICDDMDEYVFKTSDKNGTYYDTIPIFPIPEMIDSVRKDTAFHMRQRTLKTPDGCDSTVYLHLTVTPTYEYITRAEICKNDTFTWRGNGYDKAGIYYDRLTTEQGCDSNYILELFVRPVLYIPKTLHACDNQTVMHSDTLWYDPDSVRFAVETTLLWKPGMKIPKPEEHRDVHYYTLDGRCDSIIYQYYLHIHPTYDSIANATICSNESYQLHDSFIYTPAVAYHEPGSNPAVIDTLITDKLKTVTCEECEGKGCDSIFSANIRILPAYKHVDSVTICSDEKYDWQDTVLYEPLAGEYFYRKSYVTQSNCDSIYELHLTVHQAYDLEVHDTICADEYYHFGDTLLNQTGEYMDTLRTIHNCDSIVHLYLTVLDTTIVITYDTICVTEKYHFFDTIYTEPGLYDTITLNEWGCKQYNYLYLEVIDTTAYEIAIGDILCADDEEIIVYYERLSGKTLIEYSVLFDDLGHAQGFEDIYHATLDTTESYFSIPIPRGEVLPHPNPTYFDSQQGINEYVYEDKYAYPIPNLYSFKIIMHNGICGDSLQRKDTTVSFWYPSWIHEQHWNDGIVLYNEIYNGGYKFSKYQWFLNGDSILGATKEYLYVPNQLEMNQRGECDNYYQLAVTRLEDGYTTLTCPICPVLLYDTIVPQKDYFSVVPTIVSKINPTIHILSTRPGSYKITNLMGNQKQGDFAPDANNYAGSINLDEYLLYGITNQLILVTLILDTGDKRTIKVIIRN